MRVLRVANGLIRKAKPDLLKNILPDIKGMIEEREYRKLEKLGAKHKIPVPGHWLTTECFWPDGSPVWKPRRRRCHSVVRNYYNFCFGAANWKALTDVTFGTGLLSFKDTDNNIIQSAAAGYYIRPTSSTTIIDQRNAIGGILANAADDDMGLVIGTDNTAESFEDYALGTKIANGSAATQMDYAQSGLHAVTNSTLTLKDTRIRDFNNNSGGSITVEEVGEYMEINFISPTTNETVMLIRDLTGGDVVADAAQYRVTLESTLVYPS